MHGLEEFEILSEIFDPNIACIITLYVFPRVRSTIISNDYEITSTKILNFLHSFQDESEYTLERQKTYRKRHKTQCLTKIDEIILEYLDYKIKERRRRMSVEFDGEIHLFKQTLYEDFSSYSNTYDNGQTCIELHTYSVLLELSICLKQLNGDKNKEMYLSEYMKSI